MIHALQYEDPGGQSVPYERQGWKEQDTYIHWLLPFYDSCFFGCELKHLL